MPIAVVRAEAYYRPPTSLPPDAWAGVPAAELVWKWVESRLGRRLVPPEGNVEQTPYWARINQNRWVADCICRSAQVVSPADPRFACTECGWGWVDLVFPADPAAVEASLASLPPYLRNWWHDLDPANPSPPVVGEEGGGA
ncbi:hypothetical protein [Streptomyces sp. A012304]|uniref:hypothetical protein n=1 Tax=Streptomyces sp. A012304 TaxID=375446 RepID=UPI00222E9E11|nr:hypothetical protein [Streptomyces sp. A012304]GKQ34599.1 hypothetical protein ALMP_11480 [Streptomyces sp. A012304]